VPATSKATLRPRSSEWPLRAAQSRRGRRVVGGVQFQLPGPAGRWKRVSAVAALNSSSSGCRVAPGRADAGAQHARHAVVPVSASAARRQCARTRPGRQAAASGRPVYQRGASGSRWRRSASRWAVKSQQVLVGQRPVDPGDGVVLAVGVVVAALAVAEFVAGGQHRRALRQQHGGQQRALQAGAALRTSGSVVGPSQPQFQLRLWPWPSRLSSPLASLWRRS
jgi:hypothetical protein